MDLVVGDAWDPWTVALDDLCDWSEAVHREAVHREAVHREAVHREPDAAPSPDQVGRLAATFEDGVVDELPLSELFRLDGFSDVEEAALVHCRGRVLDVGSAGGAAALDLQERGFDVAALDRHDGVARVLRRRGLQDVRRGSIFDEGWRASDERWDTLLFMMNGFGLCEDLAGLDRLLERCVELVAPGGSLLADGCDLRLSPAADEADRIAIRRDAGRWFGEAEIRLRYTPLWSTLSRTGEAIDGTPFRWLYVDADTLADAADRCGWRCAVVMEDGADYLARLVRA